MVVIIGIVVTLTVLSVNFNQGHQLKEQAERITAIIKLARQESILDARELAVQFDDKGYRFFALNNEGKWVPWEEQGPYREVKFPEDVKLDITIEGQKNDTTMGSGDDDTPKSLVYILSSGELTPFELTLRRSDAGGSYKITGKLNGDVAIDTDSEKG